MKKSSIQRMVVLLSAGLLSAACSRDSTDGAAFGEGYDAVEFHTVSNSGTASPAGLDNTKWKEGDEIGVFMLAQGGTTPGDVLTVGGKKAENMRYVYRTSASKFVAASDADKMAWPSNGSPVDFAAYHPYTDDLSKDDDYNFIIDGRDQSDQSKLDLLRANVRGVNPGKHPVPLRFERSMSKLEFIVVKGEGMAAEDFSDLNIKLRSLGLQGTIGLLSGQFSKGSPVVVSSINGYTVKDGERYEMIVIPHKDVECSVQFDLGEGSYIWEIPKGTQYEAGYCYTWTVTINKTGVEVVSVNIAPWTGVDDAPTTGSTLLVEAFHFEENIWATKATLTGQENEILDGMFMDFYWRKVGAFSWDNYRAAKLSSILSYRVTGLEPETSYEYYVEVDGKKSAIKSFRTEKAAQLPNSGFEDWIPPYSAGSYYRPWNDGDDQFWDTNNAMYLRSTALNDEMTEPDYTIYSSGAASVRLTPDRTQDLLLSADLFTGKNLDHGPDIIAYDLGREFYSRPAALNATVKGSINIINIISDVTTPELNDVFLGDNDAFYMYVAIGDWDAPVEVRRDLSSTVDNWKFFDKNDSHIIAYGEVIRHFLYSAFQEITIPLTYRTLIRKPKYIVVFITSNRYGEYFTGSSLNQIWVDDIELIYE